MKSLSEFFDGLEGVSVEDAVRLDAMSKGELGKLQGTSLYEPTLRLLATIYARQKVGATKKAPPRACPHGFAMKACNRCLAEGTVVSYE